MHFVGPKSVFLVIRAPVGGRFAVPKMMYFMMVGEVTQEHAEACGGMRAEDLGPPKE